VSGLVADKRAWTLSDLQALPQTSMVIKHICVEGWSYIGGWTGVPLRLFLERVGADLRAKYLAFKTADNYPSSIDMASALHPQTLLALKYGGDTLAVPFASAHGGQARLQEPEMGHGHRGDQQISGRILGIVGLSMVRRDLSAMASLCGILAVAGAAHAQSKTPGGMPPPAGISLAESAGMRFPQPVRVGDLLGREVLRPVESQDVLGRVRRVVRDRNGQIMVVINFGGFLGFGSRLIAVPVDAMVLLGQDMEIVAFMPKQPQQFPTFSPSGTSDVPDDTITKSRSRETLSLTIGEQKSGPITIEPMPSAQRDL
jgi:hypothetical protein